MIPLIISFNQPTSSLPPEFPLPLILFIIFLGAVALAIISYIAYKKMTSQRRNKLEKFLSRCTDISIINDVIVIDSKSGIDIFSQSFGGRNLDTSLISGFLQAISNFRSTISEAAKESRTLIIEYKDSIVMQTEFVNLKLIITLKENPSANFKFIMEDLAYDIYKQYGEEIDKFTGILKPFHNMSELIEKHLNTSFLYPLKIVENPKTKLNAAEKDMIAKARTFMKESNFNHFYSLYLMPKNYFKKDDIDGDDYDRFPYPYIYNPPKPPDDLAPAAQVQVRTPSEEKNSEEEVNCQYCGMDITKEEQFTHSCKKKPE